MTVNALEVTWIYKIIILSVRILSPACVVSKRYWFSGALGLNFKLFARFHKPSVVFFKYQEFWRPDAAISHESAKLIFHHPGTECSAESQEKFSLRRMFERSDAMNSQTFGSQSLQISKDGEKKAGRMGKSIYYTFHVEHSERQENLLLLPFLFALFALRNKRTFYVFFHCLFFNIKSKQASLEVFVYLDLHSCQPGEQLFCKAISLNGIWFELETRNRFYSEAISELIVGLLKKLKECGHKSRKLISCSIVE